MPCGVQTHRAYFTLVEFVRFKKWLVKLGFKLCKTSVFWMYIVCDPPISPNVFLFTSSLDETLTLCIRKGCTGAEALRTISWSYREDSACQTWLPKRLLCLREGLGHWMTMPMPALCVRICHKGPWQNDNNWRAGKRKVWGSSLKFGINEDTEKCSLMILWDTFCQYHWGE